MMRSGRNFLCLSVVCPLVLLAGCSEDAPTADSPPASEPVPTEDLSPGQVAGVDVPAGRVDDAVGKLDGIADELMASSNIPGMAIAVVHGSDVVYSKGFGVREMGKDDPIDGAPCSSWPRCPSRWVRRWSRHRWERV